MKTICFKIRPNQQQTQSLETWLSDLGRIWNIALGLLEESEQYLLREKNELLDDPYPVNWVWKRNDVNSVKKKKGKKTNPEETEKTEVVYALACDITAPYSRHYKKQDRLFPESEYSKGDYRPACSIKRLRGNQQPAMYCKSKNPYLSLCGFFAMKNHLDKPWFTKIPSVVIRGLLQELAESWAAYKDKNRESRKPKYKSGKYPLKSLKNGDAKGTKFEGNKIYFPKIGSLTIKDLSKRWNASISPSVVQIIKKPSGWYLHLTGDIPVKKYKPSKNICGLDMGLKNLLSDDLGKQIKSPKYYQREEKKLARLQRKVSRRQEFLKKSPELSQGKNLAKAKKRLARLHEKIANQRRLFNHKISTFQVRKFGTIVIRDIKIKKVIAKPTPQEKDIAEEKTLLNKHLLDLATGQLTSMIEQKAKAHDREFSKIKVPHAATDCPVCQNRIKKKAILDYYKCDNCGTRLPINVVVAKNIKAAVIKK